MTSVPFVVGDARSAKPPPWINTQTGKLEELDAVAGFHTLMKRQSSDWPLVGYAEPTERHISPHR
jgi:hypothetical protein